MNRIAQFRTRLVLAVLFAFVAPAAVRAQSEYVIGPEDVLAITVWEHPELSRTVAVRADGNITIPPLGDVPVAGKTTASLARDLEARFYNTLRITTQATVSVVSFNSQKVYLAGQVAAPGRYSFEQIPSLVDLLGMTGGLNPSADLSRVKILRREDGKTRTITADLSQALQTGEQTGVPPLKTGDVVIVPGTPTAGGGGTIGGAVGEGQPIYVLGEVAKPGAYTAAAGMDLLQFLALAGGLTPRSDLENIDIVSAGGTEGAFRVRVNLLKDVSRGRTGLTLRPGDTVIIPASGGGAFGIAWLAARQALGVSRDILNLFLIRDVLK